MECDGIRMRKSRTFWIKKNRIKESIWNFCEGSAVKKNRCTDIFNCDAHKHTHSLKIVWFLIEKKCRITGSYSNIGGGIKSPFQMKWIERKKGAFTFVPNIIRIWFMPLNNFNEARYNSIFPSMYRRHWYSNAFQIECRERTTKAEQKNENKTKNKKTIGKKRTKPNKEMNAQMFVYECIKAWMRPTQMSWMYSLCARYKYNDPLLKYWRYPKFYIEININKS